MFVVGQPEERNCVFRLAQVLEVRLRDSQGRQAAAATKLHLQAASARPLDEASVAAALGQLGDNALRTAALDTSGLDFGAGLALCSLVPLANTHASAQYYAVPKLLHS